MSSRGASLDRRDTATSYEAPDVRDTSRDSIETSATDVRGTREVTGRGISRASVAAEALRRRATTPASVSAAAAALRRRTGSRGSIAAAALRRLGS